MGNERTRFPVNRQNHTKKGPYLTPLLRKLIEKKIKFEDPETQKIIKGRVKDAIVWRYILNATQGENPAIEGIFNRLDGKQIETLLDQSKHNHIQITWKREDNAGSSNRITQQSAGNI